MRIEVTKRAFKQLKSTYRKITGHAPPRNISGVDLLRAVIIIYLGGYYENN